MTPRRLPERELNIERRAERKKGPMAYLLGIDIGTSGARSVLFHGEGGILASALAESPTAQPQNTGRSRTRRIGGRRW